MTDRAPPKAYSTISAKYSSTGAASPAGASQAHPPKDLVYPALHLYPLNDTFVPKQINLAPPSAQNRIKIGRYSNAKSVPNPSNGYFDSKVLSRAHAEVWSENDRVYIKDVKSSNGTFVNGNRLSPESHESEPYELHSEDVVDFGIDILTDDNKEILHHRVACRVFLVTTPEDALRLRDDFTSLYRGGVHGGALGNAGLCPGAEGGLRRGKPGMNLDHVIFRLQNELQKSRMVGNELSTLSTTIQSIHETLGGNVAPATQPPFPHLVPGQSAVQAEGRADPAAFAALESQLDSTHAMLASHVERIKGLESTLAAYENIKGEVADLKQQLEDTKRGLPTPAPTNEKTNAWLAYGLPERVHPPRDDDAESTASVDTAIAPEPKEERAVQPLEEGALAAEPHESPDAPPVDTVAAETAAEHAALLQRMEVLEKELAAFRQQREDEASAREAVPEAPTPATMEIHALDERLARLEQLLQTHANPTKPDQEYMAWRSEMEQRFEDQSRSLAEGEAKLRNAMEVISNPNTPRVASDVSWGTFEKDECPNSPMADREMAVLPVFQIDPRIWAGASACLFIASGMVLQAVVALFRR